jgi:hypothetical protein
MCTQRHQERDWHQRGHLHRRKVMAFGGFASSALIWSGWRFACVFGSWSLVSLGVDMWKQCNLLLSLLMLLAISYWRYASHQASQSSNKRDAHGSTKPLTWLVVGVIYQCVLAARTPRLFPALISRDMSGRCGMRLKPRACPLSLSCRKPPPSATSITITPLPCSIILPSFNRSQTNSTTTLPSRIFQITSTYLP